MRPFALLLAAIITPAGVLAQGPVPGPPAKPSPSAVLSADLFCAVGDRDLGRVKAALQAGANPNLRNWLNITPLAVASMMGDLPTARLLVSKGARVNESMFYGSALTMAAISAKDDIGIFLLEHGANPNPFRFDKTTPLMSAASKGSMGIVRGLLARKVDVNAKNDDGATALIFAARGNQPEAVKLLLDAGARVNAADSIKRTPLHYAALDGRASVAALLTAKGASAKAVDATGATPLHLAARYSGDAGTIRTLLQAGADARKADGRGKTPYQLAVKRGYRAAVSLLADARGASAGAVAVSHAETGTAATAIPVSLESIQKGMASFAKKSNCTSCHHQGLGLMTLGALARRQFPVDGKLIGLYMGKLAEDGKNGAAVMHAAAADPRMAKMVPAVDIGDFSYGASYFLGAARANGVPANPGMAEVALVVGSLQKPDGTWTFGNPRGVMQHSRFATTAMVLEVLKTYWPAERKADLDRKVAKARAWLAGAKPGCAEDMAGRVWGLSAAGADEKEIAQASQQLLAAQRSDGGWAMSGAPQSDAYTTGLSLYVLRKSAGLPASSSTLRRAVEFLIRTQDEDGTWYVAKTTGAYNNHFDASFPHGYAQYASFAGTCWATLGLLETLEERSARR